MYEGKERSSWVAEAKGDLVEKEASRVRLFIPSISSSLLLPRYIGTEGRGGHIHLDNLLIDLLVNVPYG